MSYVVMVIRQADEGDDYFTHDFDCIFREDQVYAIMMGWA